MNSTFPKTFQRQIADANNELNLDDAVKITGCWNGLAKRFDQATATESDLQGDTAHMRRAVAFSRTIKDSKAFTLKFAQMIAVYRDLHPDRGIPTLRTRPCRRYLQRPRPSHLLDWLKANAPENTCRILSNARCLSEGVDVPTLDAVLFLESP